jgi:HAE1 family hydrophobic/amphiphilic exporter-1
VLRGGKDYAELSKVAAELLEASRGIPGTVDRGITSGGGRPELSVSIDRRRAKELGISHADIGESLALVDRKGIDMGGVHDPRGHADVSVPVRLRVGSNALANADVVRQLTMRSEAGATVPLATLGAIESKEGPGLVRRTGRERQITLFMNTVPGTSDGAVVEALTKKLAEVSPSGRVHGEVIGNAQEMEKAFAAFLVAIGLSFVFMYLVLAAQFESWLHPVTILVSLPLTIPFGLVSLLIGGQSLNLFSVLGFLVLFGVVKKNAILQVDRAIQLRAEGLSAERAIVEASRDRLRPILMTTLAFVAGMVPLIVSSAAGAATNRAIAVGILGGQTLSLVLTLMATPVVYLWIDRLSKGRASRASTAPTSEGESASASASVA